MKPTQQTLATAGFELHRKRTRRDEFLAQMDQVVPWAKLCELIEPVYPKGEGAGHPTVGLERMLRIYFRSSGSTCRTRRWKRLCTTRSRWGRRTAADFDLADRV